jgi:hypothetical protein
MKRKTTSEPCKVYKYSIRLSKEGEDAVFEQLRQSRDFYNQLVEIENARRAAYRAARSAAVPPYAAAEEDVATLVAGLEDVRSAILATRKAKRAKISTADLDSEAKALRASLKVASARLKELRKEADADPAVKEEAARISELGKQLIKSAYHNSPLYWTTQGKVLKAFDQARKDSAAPRFKSFEPRGSVGGQILARNGKFLSTTTVFDGHCTVLQLDPLGPGSWDTRSARRHAYTTGRLRVGSNGRDPKWLEFDILMHRPLPSSGLIKNAWVQAETQGNRTRYELHMSIESSEFSVPPHTGGTVAIGVGWKRMADGSVHVATILDASGDPRHVTLPKVIFDRFDHCESLRSASDLHFEAVRNAVAARVSELPGWAQDELRHMFQWRSHKRLARIARRLAAEQIEDVDTMWQAWKTKRLAAGLDLFAPYSEIETWANSLPKGSATPQVATLELWRRKNAHLYQVECDLVAKARRYRDDIFRNVAASLRGCRVLASSADLKASARKANPEDDCDTSNEVRRLRAQASPGRLLELLKAEGAEIVKLPPDDQYPDVDTMTARCIALMRHAGEDTSIIEETINEQRAALSALREAAE